MEEMRAMEVLNTLSFCGGMEGEVGEGKGECVCIRQAEYAKQ
jgi:hypothetical protein